MRYILLNEQEIQSYQVDNHSTVLIQILDSAYLKYGTPYRLTNKSDYQAIYELVVDDIVDDYRKNQSELWVFDHSMKQSLLNFIDQNPCQTLVLVSRFGNSRPSALVLGLADHLSKQDWKETIQQNTELKPNPKILECFNLSVNH